jgi:CelD/BcsL family acetyltransferase involved in cellulose biosynthesis
MTTLMEVEGSGWKGIRGSSLRHNELLGRFFMNYSRLAAAEGILRIALLRIDDKVIAVQLGIEAYGRLWVLKMGYDEGHSRISPGFLLTAGVGRDAIERNLIAYEFLGSAEPWEERWGAQCRDYLTALVYPPTIFGAMAIMMDGISVIRRRTALRLRHLWADRN